MPDVFLNTRDNSINLYLIEKHKFEILNQKNENCSKLIMKKIIKSEQILDFQDVKNLIFSYRDNDHYKKYFKKYLK